MNAGHGPTCKARRAGGAGVLGFVFACVATGGGERRFRVYEEAPGFRPGLAQVATGGWRAKESRSVSLQDAHVKSSRLFIYKFLNNKKKMK